MAVTLAVGSGVGSARRAEKGKSRLGPATAQGIAWLAAFSFFFFALSTVAVAQVLIGWSVVSTAGDARYRETTAADWRPIIPGIVLAEGAQVATGQGGQVVLSRGSNTVTISAQSETQVGGARGGPVYQFFQRLGTILLHIENGPDRNFQVRTPYLAATVKGTVFSVSVDDQGSAVHVTQGLVEVTSLSSGASRLVPPGQTVRVSSAPNAPVEVIGGGTGGGGGQGGENTPGGSDTSNGGNGNSGNGHGKGANDNSGNNGNGGKNGNAANAGNGGNNGNSQNASNGANNGSNGQANSGSGLSSAGQDTNASATQRLSGNSDSGSATTTSLAAFSGMASSSAIVPSMSGPRGHHKFSIRQAVGIGTLDIGKLSRGLVAGPDPTPGAASTRSGTGQDRVKEHLVTGSSYGDAPVLTPLVIRNARGYDGRNNGGGNAAVITVSLTPAPPSTPGGPPVGGGSPVNPSPPGAAAGGGLGGGSSAAGGGVGGGSSAAGGGMGGGSAAAGGADPPGQSASPHGNSGNAPGQNK